MLRNGLQNTWIFTSSHPFTLIGVALGIVICAFLFARVQDINNTVNQTVERVQRIEETSPCTGLPTRLCALKLFNSLTIEDKRKLIRGSTKLDEQIDRLEDRIRKLQREERQQRRAIPFNPNERGSLERQPQVSPRQPNFNAPIGPIPPVVVPVNPRAPDLPPKARGNPDPPSLPPQAQPPKPPRPPKPSRPPIVDPPNETPKTPNNKPGNQDSHKHPNDKHAPHNDDKEHNGESLNNGNQNSPRPR